MIVGNIISANNFKNDEYDSFPTLSSAIIYDANPDQVVMIFDQAVKATTSNLGWSLSGTTSSSFSSVNGAGILWIGTLATPATSSETITMSYSSSTGTFEDYFGNALQNIASYSVDNDVLTPPSTSTPVLSNFRVEDAQPTRVLFDSSASISGMTKQGFIISGYLNSEITLTVNGRSTT
jgi:hypothetical protein